MRVEEGNAIAAALLAHGVAVQDGFSAPQLTTALLACAGLRRDRGDFAAARIGAPRRRRRREDLRGDYTCWLGEPLWPAERAIVEDFEQLRLALNRSAFLGLFELEMHYAWYPPGAGYARHVDRHEGSDQRQVSLVLYLNPGWEPGAGGELRLFHAHHGATDIEPLGGRLVCFLSDGLEHSVLPTRDHRWSMTGWFRRRPAPNRSTL